MKVHVIFDSSGAIVGAAVPDFYNQNNMSTAEGQPTQVGIDNVPGQTVHEVEVPDDLVQIDSSDFIGKLKEAKSVKHLMSTMVTAGYV